MSASAIEWTDETWNPVTGCTRVSPGCAHCYALELAPRLRAMGNAKYMRARDGGKGSGPAFGVTLHPDALEQPFHWRKPRRVFVNSMSDLFHDEIPDDYIARVWGVMAANPRHTFQVLTKRPERARDLLTDMNGWACTALEEAGSWVRETDSDYDVFPALPNVWLGVSIENRRYVHRADVLRDTPAAVRFISAEPLLGPLVPYAAVATWRPPAPPSGAWPPATFEYQWSDGRHGPDPGLSLDGIDWLIVGGESGARHRPVRPEWVRGLRAAAERTGTAFFFKQWGGRTPKAGGRLLDGRTWDEMPDIGAATTV
jgi:protein gp37